MVVDLGGEVAATYRLRARELRRQAHVDLVEGRPIRSQAKIVAAQRLERAAALEELGWSPEREK